jgi:hypothetical protein
MKKFLLLPLLLLAFSLPVLTGCSKKGDAGAEAAQAAGASRLVLSEDGELSLDDEALTMDALPAKIGEVKARGGSIWYHRAGPRDQRPPEAMQVLNILVEAQVPVQLYEDAEFTRPLGMNGGNAPPLR